MQSASDPFVDVRGFGAVGNGVTDDTNAIQAAVNSVSSRGGSILMKGNFVSGSIAFPSVPGWIRIELDGTWKLNPNKTLVIPPYVWLNGRGGASAPVLWARKPQAQIIPSSGTAPTIRMVGQGPKKVSNILVTGSSGPAIVMENGNFFILENVSARAANLPSSYALGLDGAILVDIAYSSFEAPQNAGGNVFINRSGIIKMERSQIIGKGVTVSSANSATEYGNMKFKSILHYLATTPSFILDSTNGVISHITVDAFYFIPSVVVPFIEVRGSQNAQPSGPLQDRRVRNVTVTNGPLYSPLVGGGSIKGLNLYTGANQQENLGTQRPEETTVIRGGEFVGKFVN